VFEPGAEVLVYNPHVFVGKSPKWTRNYQESAVVERRLMMSHIWSDINVQNALKIVHVDK